MNRVVIASVTYYASLVLVMLLTLSGALDLVMPKSVATRVGYNSEGFFLALLFAVWIQWVLPRLRSRNRWGVVLSVAAALLSIGVHLYLSDYPSRVKTLNESFLAAGLVVVYLSLRRPLPPVVAPTLVATVLGVMVFGQGIGILTNVAESLAVLLLVPVGLDVVDKGILDPAARTSGRRRLAWYLMLVAVPVTSSYLFHASVLGGGGADAVRYLVRLHEAFIAVLLVEAYFTFALGRRGRSSAMAAKGQAGTSRGPAGLPPGQRRKDLRNPA